MVGRSAVVAVVVGDDGDDVVAAAVGDGYGGGDDDVVAGAGRVAAAGQRSMPRGTPMGHRYTATNRPDFRRNTGRHRLWSPPV